VPKVRQDQLEPPQRCRAQLVRLVQQGRRERLVILVLPVQQAPLVPQARQVLPELQVLLQQLLVQLVLQGQLGQRVQLD